MNTTLIDERIESEDVSVACLSGTDDSDGLIRSWHSSIDVTILDDTDNDVTALLNDLSDSFVAEGWVARPLGGSATVTSTLLESAGTSQTDVQITGLKPDPNLASTSLEEVVEPVTVKIDVARSMRSHSRSRLGRSTVTREVALRREEST